MNIIKKIGVFFTSLFLVLSITATSSFADGHAKTILLFQGLFLKHLNKLQEQ